MDYNIVIKGKASRKEWADALELMTKYLRAGFYPMDVVQNADYGFKIKIDRMESMPKNKVGSDYMETSWCVDDVLEQAKQEGRRSKLTMNDARQIVAMMDANHDATIGINWDTISCLTDMYLDDKAKQKK